MKDYKYYTDKYKVDLNININDKRDKTIRDCKRKTENTIIDVIKSRANKARRESWSEKIIIIDRENDRLELLILGATVNEWGFSIEDLIAEDWVIEEESTRHSYNLSSGTINI